MSSGAKTPDTEYNCYLLYTMGAGGRNDGSSIGERDRPMKRFNNGKPYHGSDLVSRGRLRGATDTDHFYFFCPRCPESQVVRILEYEIADEQPENPYNKEFKTRARCGFVLAFKLHCEKCELTDFVKISNMGWQKGKYVDGVISS